MARIDRPAYGQRIAAENNAVPGMASIRVAAANPRRLSRNWTDLQWSQLRPLGGCARHPGKELR